MPPNAAEFRSRLRDVIAWAIGDYERATGAAPSRVETGAALMLIAGDYLKCGAPADPNFTAWLSASIFSALKDWTDTLHRDRPSHIVKAAALLEIAREDLDYRELARRAPATAVQPLEETHAGS